MSDRDTTEQDDELDEIEVRHTPRQPTEGVRIIGAEEAKAAIDAGQAAGKRPDDELRFGDVPPSPEGPRPPVSFPLAEDSDPSTAVEKPPVVSPSPSTVELPHWTEPPTGEVPRILPEAESETPGEDEDDLEAWSSMASPRWRDTPGDWEGADFDPDEFRSASETRVGALADRPEHSDLYSFDEPEAEPFAPEPPPVRASSRPRPQETGDEPASEGRNVPVAVATGLTAGALVLLAAWAGPTALLMVAGAAVFLAAAEFYNGLRLAGYHPATVLGLVATVAAFGAAYRNGEEAMPLVWALFVVFGFLWYLAGVIRARPAANLAVTILAFAWVGFLGSFAALLLKFPNRHGVTFLLLAIIATVAYDVSAFFVGSRFGRSPLAPDVSPNKTWEGLLGASIATVAITLAVVAIFGFHPWTIGRAFALSLVVIVFAPLGDLCESLMKRDLGVKDMGAILPGHGGLLDRLDALLFVVPATYYLVRLLELS